MALDVLSLLCTYESSTNVVKLRSILIVFRAAKSSNSDRL